jgi:hypothetical protein
MGRKAKPGCIVEKYFMFRRDNFVCGIDLYHPQRVSETNHAFLLYWMRRLNSVCEKTGQCLSVGDITDPSYVITVACCMSNALVCVYQFHGIR